MNAAIARLRYCIVDARADSPPDLSTAVETGPIAPVPAVDRAVAGYRRNLTAQASGVFRRMSPCFLPSSRLKPCRRRCVCLQTALQRIGPFACRLECTRRFGQDVLRLDPVPTDPFVG